MHDVRDALAHFRSEACQEFGSLGDPIGSDPVVEPAAGGRDIEQDGSRVARVLRSSHVALALERRHDAARGALVQAQLGGKSVEYGVLESLHSVCA
jgi:hypothetical protein